jgi:hypothetical protein
MFFGLHGIDACRRQAVPSVRRHCRNAGDGSQRKYIAGVLPNMPQHMVEWLRHPTTMDPLSAMPDPGVTEKDARDIAA